MEPVLASICFILPYTWRSRTSVPAKLLLRRVLHLFPEDGHSAVIRFTDAVCFLPDVQTLEVVVVQQMIATLFELVDSIEFNVTEWTHPGFIRTDSDQLLEVEQCACHAEPQSLLQWEPVPFSCCSRRYL
jgi:hypothetical protein